MKKQIFTKFFHFPICHKNWISVKKIFFVIFAQNSKYEVTDFWAQLKILAKLSKLHYFLFLNFYIKNEILNEDKF